MARAREPVTETAPLRSYVEARAAASAGAFDRASSNYAAALTALPDNLVLAGSALSHAIAAGDWPLAVRSATLLEASGAASPEVRMTLLAAALNDRDWRKANAQVDRLAAEEAFAFMGPVLRAWVAVGSRRGDPIAILDAADGDALAAGYIPEQRALIDLVRRRGDAAADFAAFADGAGPRGLRLRVAAAAYLARRGDRREALGLLTGDSEPIARTRALIEARRRVPGEVSTPAAGIGEFLARLSLDLNTPEARPLALSFSRLATFLAPDNSAARVIVAELLGQAERSDAALAVLAPVPAHDPFAGTVSDVRIGLLVAAGRGDEAVAAARAAAERPDARASDWTRLADTYMQLDRFGEGASAYDRALSLAGAGASDHPLWAIWLMKGSALEQAGDWAGGLAALRRAHELAPEEPNVLNYLGYAQLERRENIAEATRLVAEAHRRAPDDAAIADSLGWAHVLAGDLEAGIPLLEQAAQGQPGDVTINEHLGDAYFRAGRRIDARHAWKAALVYAEGEDRTRLGAKIERGLTPQLAAR